MDRRTGASARGARWRTSRDAERKDRLMLDSLARFVYRRRRFVAIGAVRLLRRRRRGRRRRSPSTSTRTAPTTPPPRASRPTKLLEAHGYRDAVGDRRSSQTRRSRSPATRDRVEAIERELRAPRRRRLGSPATTTRARRDFVSHDGDRDLPRGRAEADRRQGPARTRRRASRTSSSGEPGVRSAATRSPSSRSTSRSSPTCAAPRCSPSRCCSCSRCCSSAASSPRSCRC